MKILSNCPFCNMPLIVQQTKESHKRLCQNPPCHINGAIRFKMFTRGDNVTHVSFMLEGFLVSISYLDNSTSIARYTIEQLDMTNKVGIVTSAKYLVRASESEIIINEAPELEFGQIDKLVKKLQTWSCLS